MSDDSKFEMASRADAIEMVRQLLADLEADKVHHMVLFVGKQEGVHFDSYVCPAKPCAMHMVSVMIQSAMAIANVSGIKIDVLSPEALQELLSKQTPPVHH